MNKLSTSTSPYLLQHAHNPVDWHPWGEEALNRARSENKPIFLSIGYAACHWCHVMAHETFEDTEVAALRAEFSVRKKEICLGSMFLAPIKRWVPVAMTGSGG